MNPLFPWFGSLSRVCWIIFFHKAALFSTARLVGNLLKIDASIASASRPIKARVCVDLDVSKPRLARVWVGNSEKGRLQPFGYEEIPEYCKHCKKMGHKELLCPVLHPPAKAQIVAPKDKAMEFTSLEQSENPQKQ
ncbi:hypothetical protein ACH5RR_012545 [Cinchona calisaya]|uniref:Uncharacterized protein n=1 Tax=Cinchona calisaya TaxID=153742 RepID=A0ABD3A841_9GENT